ncbi:hypothetical protein ACF05T_26960 [Streptomyces lateritius]|uniref:Uncharacterized protein n=1 Tax=Streptomyces lateritius TaxID=67313 RepID=A0ABW6YJM4_9ACTN
MGTSPTCLREPSSTSSAIATTRLTQTPFRVEHDGLPLGWIAKGTARPLALALDDRPAPLVTAVLHTDPRSIADTAGTDQLAGYDQVELAITISPRA